MFLVHEHCSCPRMHRSKLFCIYHGGTWCCLFISSAGIKIKLTLSCTHTLHFWHLNLPAFSHHMNLKWFLFVLYPSNNCSVDNPVLFKFSHKFKLSSKLSLYLRRWKCDPNPPQTLHPPLLTPMEKLKFLIGGWLHFWPFKLLKDS